MSRSYKKTPVVSLTSSKSQKEWKKSYNRRLRRCNKIKVLQDDGNQVYHTVDEKGNIWDSPSDGRHYDEHLISESHPWGEWYDRYRARWSRK